jgi:hypothetical protein
MQQSHQSSSNKFSPIKDPYLYINIIFQSFIQKRKDHQIDDPLEGMFYVASYNN